MCFYCLKEQIYFIYNNRLYIKNINNNNKFSLNPNISNIKY